MARITHPETETHVEYELVYDNDGTGCSFPCDEQGRPLTDEMHPAALANLERCKAHPERYKVAGKVRKTVTRYTPPPRLHCDCGEQFSLFGRGYYGAYQCPRCGQWFDRFGAYVLPPAQWEETLEPDY